MWETCGASTIQMFTGEICIFVLTMSHAHAHTHSAVLPFCVCSFSYCVLASAVRGPQGLIKGGPPPRLFHTFSSHACVRLLRYVRNAVVLLLLTCHVWRGACCSREVTGCSRKSGDFSLSAIEYQTQSSIRGFHFISWGGPGGGLPLLHLVQTTIKQKPFLTLPF